MGQQNLRLYERKVLLDPARTPGGTRKYSEPDLVTLRRIDYLLGEGLNLAGIKMVLVLEAANGRLRDELDAAD
ncbi:DNA-binding transcriptional MerR regulator [Arthrobacter sp. CAN_A1]